MDASRAQGDEMPAARSLLVAAALVGSLLLAACTSTSGGTGRPTTSALPPASTNAAAPRGARPGSLANPRLANCGNRLGWVPGEGTEQYKPSKDDVVVGPLVFPAVLRTLAHACLGEYGEDPWYKAGVLVRAGQTVTLSIGPWLGGMAGLHSTQETSGARTPAEADQAVTFTSCGFDTPFIGGFFVYAPRCVPVEVRPAGAKPVRVVFSFLAGNC
jgi:hypothetical protein